MLMLYVFKMMSELLRRIDLKKLGSLAGAALFAGAAFSGAIIITEKDRLMYDLSSHDTNNLTSASPYQLVLFEQILEGNAALITPHFAVCPTPANGAISSKESQNPSDALDNNKKILDLLDETNSGEIVYYSLGCGGGEVLLQ